MDIPLGQHDGKTDASHAGSDNDHFFMVHALLPSPTLERLPSVVHAITATTGTSRPSGRMVSEEAEPKTWAVAYPP